MIPGRGALRLRHLVCDVEGTLTVDGRFQEGLLRPLLSLRDRLELHLLTVDAYRQQGNLDFRLGLQAVRLKIGEEEQQKRVYVIQLGTGVAAIGHGLDDVGMLEAADLSVCILSPEGAATKTLIAADLVVPDMIRALELFANPLRIVNSLRT